MFLSVHSGDVMHSKSVRSACYIPDGRGGSTNLLCLKLNVINFHFKSLDVKYALSVSGAPTQVVLCVKFWQNYDRYTSAPHP